MQTVQINSKLDPVRIKGKWAGVTFAEFIGGPVKEGSRFVSVQIPNEKEKSFGLKSIILDGYYSDIQNNKYVLTVKPNKRGICLFLYSDDVYSLDEKTFAEYKNSGIIKKGYKKLITKAIEQYAGTEWEAPLREELEEW